MLETLYWPKMIVGGGGGAKNFDKIADRIRTRARLVHTEAKNKAGIPVKSLPAISVADPACRR